MMAAVLAFTRKPFRRDPPGWTIRLPAPPGAVTIFECAAATAAGSHAGGSSDQRIHDSAGPRLARSAGNAWEELLDPFCTASYQRRRN